MSQGELIALEEYIDENLSKGFIRASSTPADAPILFIKRGDGSLKLHLNYGGINEIRVRNPYRILLIQEALIILSKAKWFTKLALR